MEPVVCKCLHNHNKLNPAFLFNIQIEHFWATLSGPEHLNQTLISNIFVDQGHAQNI